MLCRGMSLPSYLRTSQAPSAGAGVTAQQRYQIVDVPAFLSYFDTQTAKSFPVRVLAHSGKVVNRAALFTGSYVEGSAQRLFAQANVSNSKGDNSSQRG